VPGTFIQGLGFGVPGVWGLGVAFLEDRDVLEELEEAIDHVRDPLAQREQELCRTRLQCVHEVCPTRLSCVYHVPDARSVCT